MAVRRGSPTRTAARSALQAVDDCRLERFPRRAIEDLPPSAATRLTSMARPPAVRPPRRRTTLGRYAKATTEVWMLMNVIGKEKAFPLR